MDIFSQSSARQIVQDAISKRKEVNSRYSLRMAAKQISISPTHLSMFINGDRSLTFSSAKKIAKWLNLNDKEFDYFLHLIEFESGKNNYTAEEIQSQISALKNEKSKNQSLLEELVHLDANSYSKALEIIQDCLARLKSLSHDSTEEKIYQLGLQLLKISPQD